MRRKEEKFATPQVRSTAQRLAASIKTARLARNMTQAASAERAKMSGLTWLKIEKGDVSVSMGSWLAALECVGMLDTLDQISAQLPPPTTTVTDRQRARPSKARSDAFDF